MDRASKFFSSVLRKPIGSPDAFSRDQASERTSAKQGNILQEGVKDDFDDGGLSDLGQLLQKNTYSKAEFDHLSELLNSRIIDVSTDKEIKNNDPQAPLRPLQFGKWASTSSSAEKNVEESKFFGRISTPGIMSHMTSCKVFSDETASPAEIAKAFMDFRPSKPSPYVLCLRSQALTEAAILPGVVPFRSKSSDLLTASGSSFRFSGLSEKGSKSPRTQRRYEMPHSPFSRNPMVSILAAKSGEVGISGPSTSHSTTPTLYPSIGKEVLKRRISDLSSDVETFSPCLTRQKTNIWPHSRGKTLKFSEKYLCTSINDSQRFMPFKKKSLFLDGGEYEPPAKKIAEAGEGAMSVANFSSFVPKSTKMERKILQYLDQLVSPPKQKLPKLKGIASCESPSKLAFSVLQGQALRSTDLSRIHNVEGSANVGGPSTLTGKNLEKAFGQEMLEEDGPLISPLYPKTKVVDATKGVACVIRPSSTDSNPWISSSGTIISGCMAQKGNVFPVQASMGSLEQNADNYGSRDSCNALVTGKELKSSLSDDMRSKPKPSFQKTSLLFSTESNMVLNTTPSRKAVNGVLNVHIASKREHGFTFPIVSDTSLSQPPPTPTMLSPLVKDSSPRLNPSLAQSESSKEQTLAQTFSFGSKNVSTLKFSSTTSGFSD